VERVRRNALQQVVVEIVVCSLRYTRVASCQVEGDEMVLKVRAEVAVDRDDGAVGKARATLQGFCRRKTG
jgi:hypothetical protein